MDGLTSDVAEFFSSLACWDDWDFSDSYNLLPVGRRHASGATGGDFRDCLTALLPCLHDLRNRPYTADIYYRHAHTIHSHPSLYSAINLANAGYDTSIMTYATESGLALRPMATGHSFLLHTREIVFEGPSRRNIQARVLTLRP